MLVHDHSCPNLNSLTPKNLVREKKSFERQKNRIFRSVNLQHVSEELEVYMELLTMRCIQSFSVGHTPMLPFTGCGSGLQPRALG
jgi:hypothetical protein